MTITLLMATSINGFIAGPNDDTEWIKDFELLNSTIADYGVVIYGKRTYDECVKYEVFPYPKALNVVLTHDKELLNSAAADQILFTDAQPEEILVELKSRGFDQALLIGGGHLNASFLQKGLVDEIILDIHPYLLSEGIKLIEGQVAAKDLELQEFKQLHDQILQVRYSFKK